MIQELPKSGGRRQALLIATSTYMDLNLRQLRAPGRDASELAEVLRDPRIGGFEVQTELDALSGELHEKIEDFCADRHPNDQLLVYLSCHGVLDDNGRLYYAATNTRRHRLAATGVAAAWLNERLEDCRARRQILILDCCHSGAFARGAKGDASLALQQRFEPRGRGRVVLTASRSTEYAFEGGRAIGEGLTSVFTDTVITGLRTGEADRDKDGLITVNDLYHYVYDNVRAIEPRQTPELWTYGAEGDLLVAHSIRAPAIGPTLPEDLRITLESPRPRVRASGVAELAELLRAPVPGLALAAREALQNIAESDIPAVAEVAREALSASPSTAASQVLRVTTEQPGQEEQTRRGAPDQGAGKLDGPPCTEADDALCREDNEGQSAATRNGAQSALQLPRAAQSASETVAMAAETREPSSAPPKRYIQHARDVPSSNSPEVVSGIVVPRSEARLGPGARTRSSASKALLSIVGAPTFVFAFLCVGTAMGQRSDVPHLGPGNWIAYAVSLMFLVLAFMGWVGVSADSRAASLAIAFTAFGCLGAVLVGWFIGSHIGLEHLGIVARDWLGWRF